MVATLVVLAAALVFPRFEGTNVTLMGLATEAMTYGLVTLALNLLMGYGGQVSVGQAGFLAVGAYTAVILATRYSGLPFIVVLAAGGPGHRGRRAGTWPAGGMPALSTTSPSPRWASGWPFPRSRSTSAA